MTNTGRESIKRQSSSSQARISYMSPQSQAKRKQNAKMPECQEEKYEAELKELFAE